MREINITVSPQYKVVIDKGLLGKVGEYINSLGTYNKIAIITDDIVASFYLPALEKSLQDNFDNVYSFAFKSGESSKCISTLSNIYDFLAESEVTRSDLVIALGGGVVGDIVGFASSTYLRGVDFINIPTTLLSMVDSSVGGKTAVNISAGKNLVGAFYQPRLVLCDTDVLSTLQDDQVADGVGEIAKYAILEDKGIIDDLLSDNLTLCPEMLIEKCVMIKNDYVTGDVFDKGKRQLLNLGHTLGHAIEKHSNFKVAHGKAVLMGMYMLAEKFSGTKEIDYVLSALESVGNKFNMAVKYEVSADDLWHLAVNDKKRHGDMITLARPYAIGDCRLDDVCVSNPINLTNHVKKSVYDVEVIGGLIAGKMIAPSSKSDLHRLLILAGFSGRKTVVNNVMYSDDIVATLDALSSLGVQVEKKIDSVILTKGIVPMTANIYCNESGSTFRFFMPICAMLGVNATFNGSKRLGERGYSDIINSMQSAVNFSSDIGLPLTIKGKYDTDNISVSGAISSQFISGILLGAFASGRGITINVLNSLQSAKYVDMTIDTLRNFGVKVEKNDNIIKLKYNNSNLRDVFEAESDYSNGAFFNVAGVHVVYNNPQSLQGDKVIIDILNAVAHSKLPFDIDMENIPDLAPILSVFATQLTGVSVLRNCARLRLKECDRLEAIMVMMSKCGVHAELIGDDIYITGGNAKGGFESSSEGDHRVAMSLAILATFVGNITIRNAGVVSKSYPKFWEDFTSVGGKINVINIR